ncbi:AAA-like domain protein [bacterium BMS3Bbin07]|nr:AAA-like domain protein [bacterium BMS3Bbin07]
MRDLKPYIYTNKKSGKWHSFFAVRLASVTVFDPSSGDYKDFAFKLLNRQIDFINSLDCPEDGRAFELRFICRPDRTLHVRGRIDIVLIAMVSDTEKDISRKKADDIFHDIWSMLAAISDYYEFECITIRDDFLSVYDPFPVQEIVEIMRREDIIEIETAKRLRGFSAKKESYADNENRIYFVYPFIWSANSLSRLFSVMLFQDAPCFLSISLKPVDFSDKIEQFFIKQIDLCEKYLASESQARSPVNARIEFITKTLQSQLLRLEDSPFLMKMRIASNGKVQRALIDSFGVEITEHAGSPDLIKDSNDAYVFSGGYDWHCFSDGQEKRKEIENLKHMNFGHYAGTLADKKDSHARYLFDANQANCAFRFPLPRVNELPGIETRFYKKVLPPTDVPTEGIVIGKNVIHGQPHYVRLSEDDRRRHMYVVGQTGTGKSTVFLKMILQDIDDNKGVAVLDPHGELVNEIMHRIPERRIEDVIYVNFEDIKNPVAFNMLEYRNELEKDFVVDQMFEIFDKLYDLKRAGGPMFEQYMKNALFLIMDDPDSGATLLEVQKVFAEPEFREYKLSKCRNRYIREFWKGIACKAGGDSSLENMAPYITSKLSMFIYNNTMRNIISSQRSSIDMRKVMDDGKILLVDLCKGKLGNINSHFLGMILVYKILMAALSRRDVKDKKKLKDFYLYVDEFQNLATDSFISILSEARKYRLSAILTNQYLTQVPPEVQSAIIGNVGTIMSFRVGMADAEVLEREFYPVFTKSDLMNLPNWRVCISMLASGEALRPFGMQTVSVDSQKNPRTEKKIRDLSKKRYGRRPEEIEREIAARWNRAKTPREQIEELLKEQ